MKELKSFFTKIRATLLLIEAPLVNTRGLTGDVETHGFNVNKMFLPKCQYFLHQALLFTHLCTIYYFPCVTLACILFFPKISLFTFLIHLELINYFPCVTLACILLSFRIDFQGLHIDEKLSTSNTSIWPMMMLFGSTGKSHHWTVGLVVDLGEDMVSWKS